MLLLQLTVDWNEKKKRKDSYINGQRSKEKDDIMGESRKAEGHQEERGTTPRSVSSYPAEVH